jgi:hypothetical protein
MRINHFKEAKVLYEKYRTKQEALEKFEKDVLKLHDDNQVDTKIDLRDQTYYKYAANSRNATERAMRNEILMAIMGSLEQIRETLARHGR